MQEFILALYHLLFGKDVAAFFPISTKTFIYYYDLIYDWCLLLFLSHALTNTNGDGWKRIMLHWCLLWWASGGAFFYRSTVYPWGYTNFIDVNIFFELLLVCFSELLNFLVVQMQCMIHYYHTLYLMTSFRCSTLTRFKVYLANWKCSPGPSICLKNRCLDLETGHSPLSLKSQFENQKNSIPPWGIKHKKFLW